MGNPARVVTLAASNLYAWYEIAGIILAVPVAGTIIWAVIKSTSHIVEFHQAIVGRPEGVGPRIPSMQERFSKIEEHLTEVDDHLNLQDQQIHDINSQFSMNGGGTVKDDLIEVKQHLGLPAKRVRA